MASDADHRLAGDLAAQAGAVLVELRSRLQAEGVDPSIIGDRGDALAHELIVGRLGVERPGDFVLSEESSDDERSDRSRLGADRVWIVDPLDGTREFREGRSDWAVHVALVEDGSPTAGAVALPAFGVLDATDPSASTAPTAARGTSASPHRTRVVLSRSRPSALATSVAASLGATVEPMGSAGAKAMAVLHGDADVYLSPGALNEWDACAPVAVALAAGLHVSRLDGTPVRFNRTDTLIDDLVVCRFDLAAAVIDAVAQWRSTDPGHQHGDLHGATR